MTYTDEEALNVEFFYEIMIWNIKHGLKKMYFALSHFGLIRTLRPHSTRLINPFVNVRYTAEYFDNIVM